MTENLLYRQLQRPWIYRLQQFFLAPGAEKAITAHVSRILRSLPPARHILDVGCGPSSWLWRVDLHPVGLDVSLTYAMAFSVQVGPSVVGSATALPFRDHCFDGVWSIGMLHHLPDNMARQSIGEMIRVCRGGGYWVIFDAVLPQPGWQRPLAYIQRRADRGRHVRHESQFRAILPREAPCVVERLTYTISGLEAILAYGILP